MHAKAHNRFIWAILSLLIILTSGCQQNTEPTGGRPLKIIVGISPFLPVAEKEAVFKQLLSLVLDEMPLNASLWVYDAFHIQSIATFDIPERTAFRSTRTRLNQFSGSIQSLRSFLQSSPTEIQETTHMGAIRFPQWSNFIGNNQIRENHDTRLVVLGNPLYIDEREPDYSMREDYFPSDGHLDQTTQESVYGTTGKSDQLLNIPIHWGYLREPWMNPAHEEAVSRFWKLYTQKKGGRLETFCLDLPTVFNRLLHPRDASKASQETTIKPMHTRVEMIRIQRKIGSTDWITSNLSRPATIHPPTMLKGPIKVGIRWQGALDLDLYARADRNANTLFFDNSESPKGFYYKDHRQSPDREFEFIEYHQPIELDQLKVWVNLFEGQLETPPEFEARIEFDRQIYSKILNIPSLIGNQGQTGSGQRDCWVEIDLMEIMGLLPPRERTTLSQKMNGASLRQ